VRPELHPAVLQAAVVFGLALTSALLARTYRKPVFAWWTAAWTIYLLRLLAIMAFVVTGAPILLFWHQVLTGWSALALLGTALVFSEKAEWRSWYLGIAAIPLLWAWVAMGQLDNVSLAAIPAAFFLAGATLHTGWVFFKHAEQTASTGARVLAAAYGLWAFHHLDYPLLRARGAWIPWGYYLDILLALAVGAGMLLLVAEDLRRGVGALATVSRELASSAWRPRRLVLDTLLGELLRLPSVRGAAFYGRRADGGLSYEQGAGACDGWTGDFPASVPFPFSATLRVPQGAGAAGALLIVGDARNPFAALDRGFLVTLGEQIGAALDASVLAGGLRARTRDLQRLQGLVVRQHEEERRRFARELHDETAQVLAAVKMELAVLRDRLPKDDAVRLEDALALLSSGIRGIRGVARDLRPTLLDDLGLVPALESLCGDFEDRSGVRVTTSLPDATALGRIAPEGELALFRALQEALTNVSRHANASQVWVTLTHDATGITLTIRDDGRGLTGAAEPTADGTSHVGLAGMRERLAALGGSVDIGDHPGGGAAVMVRLPPARDSN
jgi:signal transduction histidine kinase